MRQMGLKPVKFPSKRDAHPKKGYANFWETEMKAKNGKSRERRETKKQNKI